LIERLLVDNDIGWCLEELQYRCEFGVEESGILDPDSGYPISQEWLDALPTGSVQWLADLFVGQFYDRRQDRGIGPRWEERTKALSAHARRFLIGNPIGPPHRRFDPTGAGSYFLDLDAVDRALAALPQPAPDPLAAYVELLERAGVASMGVYVRIET
jgi:hypothetical protein